MRLSGRFFAGVVRWVTSATSGVAMTMVAGADLAPTVEQPSATVVGVAHIGGLYAFSQKDHLNEGADAVLGLGVKCIKVSLSLDAENPTPKMYPFHSDWPEAKTLDELADTPYFRELFGKPFDVFILMTFRPGKPAGYWRTNFSDEDEKAEEKAYEQLARFLQGKYGNTGKRFVLQNWEGDWALRGAFDPKAVPDPQAVERMIRWLKARQRGVEKGRAAALTDPKVFHACEVNLVGQEMEKGLSGVTGLVLPHVELDLASYSAWDTTDRPERFRQALDFISSHMRQQDGPFGKRNVYVGEFGLPETTTSPEKVVDRCRTVLTVSREWGCPFAVYWQLYCNEPIRSHPIGSADYKGFWLTRPDGSASPVRAMLGK